MSESNTKIVADIGGTNARFGLVVDGVLQEESIRKYSATGFDSLEKALSAYCEEVDAGEISSLLIATAGRHNAENNTWNFINEHDENLHKWVIDPKTLGEAGYPVYFVLNDFEAATWGLSVLDAEHQTVLRAGAPGMPDYPKMLTGPGTGLGFGYLERVLSGAFFVRGTFGAHMLAAPAPGNDEHWEIIKAVGAAKEKFNATVYEDLISGQGLFNIYHAHCKLNGNSQELDSKSAMFNNLSHADMEEPLRLFHEMFGTYLSSVFVPGHAKGGLYLTGGVTDMLIDEGLFDLDTLLEFMAPDLVGPVKGALTNVKVAHVTDEFIPLRGLVAAEQNGVPCLISDAQP